MREKIIEIMKQAFGTDNLPDNPSQKNVRNWDSMNHLNLVLELENEFGVEFEPEEISAMQDLETIERTLWKKLGK